MAKLVREENFMTNLTQSNEQLTMFNTCEFPSYEEIKEAYTKGFERDVVNLRQELKNEIPNTTYLTHAIHNVYPAKFIPQVPRFVIKKFNLKEKIILDPFAGSGTTAVESILTENSNISNDINPITRFLIDIKTLTLNPRDYFIYKNQLNHYIETIFKTNSKFIPKWENIDYWYPENILFTLTKIWAGIYNIDENESHIKNILKASALYLSRKYSYGEDESPKLFKSKEKIIKIKELINKFNEMGEDLMKYELLKKANQYLECIIQFNLSTKREFKKIDSLDNNKQQFLMVFNNSIEKLEQNLPEEMIDCIITSPPYIYAQEYFRSTKIDMFWLDMINDESIRCLTKKEIGQKIKPFCDFSDELLRIESYRSTFETIKNLSLNFKTKENIFRFRSYFNDMLYFVKLSNRLLKKKGILAIFIGEPKVFGYPVKVKDIISEMEIQNNFRIKYTFFDIIKSRHLSKNRLNDNPEGIEGEWLIIGEKL
ncbi:MAG: DNA methyltransferase [bacterium]|nr:DNA methyltransferase [bacterium]